MAAFEGAISDLSAIQLEYISSVLDKQGFGDAKVTITPVGKVGDNYVANVKRFNAEKDGNIFRMVVKIAPTIEQMRSAVLANKLFTNEYVMYTEVLPKFTELEKDAGIPEDERLRYATCYGGLLEEPYELILLEDLEIPGYNMLDKFKSMTDETIKLVLKNFAKLHSLSYALKNQDLDTYEAFKKSLTNSWEAMSDDENTIVFFTQLEKDTNEILTSDVHKESVKDSISKISSLQKKLYNTDYSSRYSVIQQGDPWTNNIMFKCEDDKTVECCMIDYQLSKVNSPVADIHYMIFNCTDYATRSKHYHEWINFYYSQLKKSLSDFGLKADYYYPRKQLDADLKRHGRVALGVTVLLSSTIIRQDADAAKFKDFMLEQDMAQMIQASRITEVDEGTINIFKTRVEGAIDSLLEYGYL